MSNLPPDHSNVRDFPTPPRFALGQVVATRSAIALMLRAGISPLALLARHVKGDWGDVDAHDAAQNELALLVGSRLMSVYPVQVGALNNDHPSTESLWVITEADRSVTTILLPQDY